MFQVPELKLLSSVVEPNKEHKINLGVTLADALIP